jgi:hypothetical protein
MPSSPPRSSRPPVLLRYAVDRDLFEAAEKVCTDLELDLIEVMRELLRRIALERAIPFELGTAVRIQGDAAPFTRYSAFLEADLAPLEPELVLARLGTFIAERSARIAEANAAPEPDEEQIASWTRELDEAIALHRTLDVRDTALLARVEARFRALLAAPPP